MNFAKLRILVFGSTGLLGHQVVCKLRDLGHEVTATIRRKSPQNRDILKGVSVLDDVAAENLETCIAAIEQTAPDLVINCIGARGAILADEAQTWLLNSRLPHFLAEQCTLRNIRMIHISSDGVFSGKHGPYAESAIPDPQDLYGKSKLAGEVSGTRILTLRLSVIGRELDAGSGFLEWAIANRGKAVNGHSNAWTTALAAPTLARLIGVLAHDFPALDGIWHLAGPEISKCDLLEKLNLALGLDLKISPVADPRIDRRLDGRKLADIIGLVTPGWDEMLLELGRELPPSHLAH